MSAGGGEKIRDYTVQAIIKSLSVLEFLAQGEILDWKTIKEVSQGSGVSENTCYRILETLVSRKWAEKSTKGYRQNSTGLARHAVYAKKYLDKISAELTGEPHEQCN